MLYELKNKYLNKTQKCFSGNLQFQILPIFTNVFTENRSNHVESVHNFRTFYESGFHTNSNCKINPQNYPAPP